MKNQYFSAAKLRLLGLTALLAGGATTAAHAQFEYNPGLTTNTTGTYTDLGTNGTVIATANTDDANSAATNIGFTFTFNQQQFTQFVLNTNGLMRLGANGPSSTMAASPYAQVADSGPINSTDANDVNLIMPFNFDLTAGTSTPEYRVYTTGTLGNRICTIQWKNVSDKAVATNATTPATLATQYANFSFQVKLYEGSNQIDFVYGTATAGTGTEVAKFANVGIKGSDNMAGNDVIANKASVTAWSGATFTDGPQPAGNAHNFRKGVLPDVGRTYHFNQLVPNDAQVYYIYTLGKLSRAALPNAVQAAIVNSGSNPQTNLVVTLTVTGANSFTSTKTVAALASNDYTIVTFDPLPATFVPGVNNVTVTVPADGNPNNNSLSVQQTVNTNSTFSYIPSDQTNISGRYVIGSPIAGGIYATKFKTNIGGTVTSASIYLSDAGTTASSVTAVGKSVYAVLTSATGTILARSADYTILATDIGTYHTFAFTTTPAVAAGASFLIGLAQPTYTGARYYPMAIQTEGPTRTDAYFTVPITGGTPTDLSTDTSGDNTFFGRLMMEANLSIALATSKELGRALTVYPNPSTSGIFTLDVKGANAGTTGLGVEVTNQLGQRVYTGSARDNYSNQLDLSNLAPGIYHLTVRNGSDYSSSKLAIGQ